MTLVCLQFAVSSDAVLQSPPCKSSCAVMVHWKTLWNMNKKIIDPVPPRHTAIEVSHKVIATITNIPSFLYLKSCPRHPKNLNLGGNAIVPKITRSGNSMTSAVCAIDLELHLDGDVKKNGEEDYLACNFHAHCECG